MERVLLLGCFWSPYCLTLVAVLFETGRRIVWRERIWGSLNRNIDLRSKVLSLGKIKILLLFRSLIRTFVAHLIYNVRVREKNNYGREGISGQI